MSELLRKTDVQVTHELDRVLLTIGNTTMKMMYRDAFTLAAWLRANAAEAKRFAGDTSNIYTAIGMLSDAEENYKRGIK